MQFKSVIAAIAALSVARVFAAPAENVVARDVQKEDMVNQSEHFAAEHAGQIPTADFVAQASHAADWYGPQWADRDYDWSPNVPWLWPQYYYLNLYQQWPNQYNTWSNSYNSKNCLLFC